MDIVSSWLVMVADVTLLAIVLSIPLEIRLVELERLGARVVRAIM